VDGLFYHKGDRNGRNEYVHQRGAQTFQNHRTNYDTSLFYNFSLDLNPVLAFRERTTWI
jgi:hypothetical protein